VDVIVYDLPTTPVIVATPANPLCEGSFTNLDVSASNSGNNFVNWSNGQSGNVINVIHANTYQATFTNAAGCSSSDDISIYELPNLDWVIFGCFDYCREDVITIPGSTNEYEFWQWEANTVSGTYSLLSGSGPVQDFQLGALPMGVYTITLQVMDYNSGCRRFSDPILITVRSCPCERIEAVYTEAIYCLGIDANGVGQYWFSFEVFPGLPMPLPGTFSLSSGTAGLGVSLFSQTFNGTTNSYQIEGMISFDNSFHVLEHCIVLTYDDPVDPENSCVMPVCFRLPECEGIGPCDFELTEPIITCLGLDSNGDPVYGVNFSILPPPGSFSASFSTTAGILSGFPATVNGSGPYYGTFTNTLPHDPELCIQINYFTLPDRAECFSYNCFGVPQCPGVPDRHVLPVNSKQTEPFSLSLVPNPTGGITEIRYKIAGENEAMLMLYDTRGKMLQRWNLIENEGKVLVSAQNYQPGIYLVGLKTQSQTGIVKKLVILHQ
jgi:hypothetical protein